MEEVSDLCLTLAETDQDEFSRSLKINCDPAAQGGSGVFQVRVKTILF